VGPVPLHLGTLHPLEQLLTFVIAFGPFVVLGLVVRRQRRRDADAAEGADAVELGDTEKTEDTAHDVER
jgi:hypothetical protein